jgi:hypothetical protein
MIFLKEWYCKVYSLTVVVYHGAMTRMTTSSNAKGCRRQSLKYRILSTTSIRTHNPLQKGSSLHRENIRSRTSIATSFSSESILHFYKKTRFLPNNTQRRTKDVDVNLLYNFPNLFLTKTPLYPFLSPLCH